MATATIIAVIRQAFSTLRQDIPYAIRGLRRSPGFAVAIMLILGVGVGANVAVFGVLDRIFLQPPPGVRDPASLRRLWQYNTSALYREKTGVTGTYDPEFRLSDLADFSTATQGKVAFVQSFDWPVALKNSNEKLLAAFVSEKYFQELGVHAARGRVFLSDEFNVGNPANVAVISDALWRRQFSSDTGVVGKLLITRDATYTIVGVGPREFGGMELSVQDFWVPIPASEAQLAAIGASVSNMAINMFARMNAGLNDEVLAQLLTRAYIPSRRDRIAVDSTSRVIVSSVLASRGPEGTASGRLTISAQSAELVPRLSIASALVLIIAIANVASLLLMRAIKRRREIAVRLALGVTRSRLISQLFIESLLLAASAGAFSLLVSSLAGNVFRVTLSSTVRWPATILNDHLLYLTIMVCIGAGLLSGIAPALFAWRANVGAYLKTSSSMGMRSGADTRTVLLVIQASLCMGLLAVGGMFAQSLRRGVNADRGVDVSQLIEVNLSRSSHDPEDDVTRVRRTLRDDPAIEAVSRTQFGYTMPGPVTKIGPNFRDTIGVGARGPFLDFVDHEFIRTMGLRVVAGRPFTEADNSVPSVVLSEALAARLFLRQNPVGQCVHVREPDSPCRVVVGVVVSSVTDLRKPAPFRIYVPLNQSWQPQSSIIPNTLIVRMRQTATDADAMRLTKAIQKTADGMPMLRVLRIGRLIDDSLRPWRLAANLFLLMGALGLIAAAIGIFGLISYDVTQRSRELGVRIALGATSRNVLQLVLVRGAEVMAIGLGVGALLAIAIGRLMSSLMFETPPYDPTVLVLTAVTLVATAVVASLVPAWRAVRVDPMVALSAE